MLTQRVEVNCVPRSDVRRPGTPKQATQVAMKASAQVAASIPARGMASGQQLDRTTMVKRYFKPSAEVGKRAHQVHMDV